MCFTSSFLGSKITGPARLTAASSRLGMSRRRTHQCTTCRAPAHLGAIRKTVRAEGIEAILSANIMPSFLANFAGVPLVFDYLDHLEESASIYYPRSFKGRIVKRGVSMMTRYNLLHARSVITVTEELKSYLQGVGVSGIDGDS